MENSNLEISQELIDKYNADQEFLRKLESVTNDFSCQDIEEALDNVMSEALFYEGIEIKTISDAYCKLLRAKALWRQTREYLKLEPNERHIEVSDYQVPKRS